MLRGIQCFNGLCTCTCINASQGSFVCDTKLTIACMRKVVYIFFIITVSSVILCALFISNLIFKDESIILL